MRIQLATIRNVDIKGPTSHPFPICWERGISCLVGCHAPSRNHVNMRTLSSEVAAMLNPVPIMACSWADKEQGKKKVTAGVVCCGQKCLGTRFTGQVGQRGNHFTSASTNGMASQQFLLQ